MANADAAPFTRIMETPIPAVATAGNDLTTEIGVCREDEVVTAVTYVPNATITGQATNNRTLTVVDKGAAGSGNTTIATITYGAGTNAAALVENPIPLSGTAANLQVSKGDVLVLTSVHVGTGITDPGGLLRVTLSRR
jgi:hypothetical protein